MLAAATGRINAARAMEYLLSNPNLHPEEARANLLREFQRAQSPEEAGQKVATTLYDLMIARHP